MSNLNDSIWGKSAHSFRGILKGSKRQSANFTKSHSSFVHSRLCRRQKTRVK
jgi:hypothetical protein